MSSQYLTRATPRAARGARTEAEKACQPIPHTPALCFTANPAELSGLGQCSERYAGKVLSGLQGTHSGPHCLK